MSGAVHHAALAAAADLDRTVNKPMALNSLRIALGATMLGALLLAGCAAKPHEPLAQINDPYESTNRKSLAFNQSVFGPISSAYHNGTPVIIRQGISNVTANLKEPRIFGNDLLQLRFAAGAMTFARFAINSSFGIGGLFDVASTGNIKKQTGDFGETLFVWGVDDGPYLVSPFFGPSTARDAVGLVVDQVADPASWALSTTFGNPATFAFAGAGFVSQVDQLKQAETSSIDFYSFLRSAYYQNRRAELREAVGLPTEVQSPADLTPAEPPAPAPRKHRAARKHHHN